MYLNTSSITELLFFCRLWNFSFESWKVRLAFIEKWTCFSWWTLLPSAHTVIKVLKRNRYLVLCFLERSSSKTFFDLSAMERQIYVWLMVCLLWCLFRHCRSVIHSYSSSSIASSFRSCCSSWCCCFWKSPSMHQGNCPFSHNYLSIVCAEDN